VLGEIKSECRSSNESTNANAKHEEVEDNTGNSIEDRRCKIGIDRDDEDTKKDQLCKERQQLEVRKIRKTNGLGREAYRCIAGGTSQG
jgi:hypothetical protein